MADCLRGWLDAGAAILDATGRAPRQGDGDEGRALVVDDPDRDPWSTALATGAALLGAPDWWPTCDGGVQAQLVGALGRTRHMPRPRARARQFSEAGQVFLRSRVEDGPEIWCRCDGGPHGYLSIAAHAHADALSVEVRHDGVDILADPGTYCYHGEPEWREWFRSTAAHNTVELGGRSQAEPGGPFLWLTHPHTRTLTCVADGRPVQAWSGTHDGYRRLRTPTVHRRAVTLDSPGRLLSVVDTFETAGEVPLQLSWHLGPDVSVELDGATAALTWRVGPTSRHGRLVLPDGLEWTAHTAQTDPPCGWYSPRFGHRVPATSLGGAGHRLVRQPTRDGADPAMSVIRVTRLRHTKRLVPFGAAACYALFASAVHLRLLDALDLAVREAARPDDVWGWVLPGLTGALMGSALLLAGVHPVTDVIGAGLLAVAVLTTARAAGVGEWTHQFREEGGR